MSEYFVSLVSNLVILTLEYAILCILYWLHRKFVVAKIVLFTAVVLASSLLFIGLIKFTQQPDVVKITPNIAGVQTQQTVILTGSTIDKLLKETKALPEGNRSQFDVI
jgi:hypothetical protein